MINIEFRDTYSIALHLVFVNQTIIFCRQEFIFIDLGIVNHLWRLLFWKRKSCLSHHKEQKSLFDNVQLPPKQALFVLAGIINDESR